MPQKQKRHKKNKTKKAKQRTKKTKQRTIAMRTDLVPSPKVVIAKSISIPKSPPPRFKCCICSKELARGRRLEASDPSSGDILQKYEFLETTRCKLKGPYYKHPICQDCWWGNEKIPGFAEESGRHECPGCKHNVPPIRITPPKLPPKVIDLVDSP